MTEAPFSCERGIERVLLALMLVVVAACASVATDDAASNNETTEDAITGGDIAVVDALTDGSADATDAGADADDSATADVVDGGFFGDCGSGCDVLAPGGDVVGDAGSDGTGPDAEADADADADAEADAAADAIADAVADADADADATDVTDAAGDAAIADVTDAAGDAASADVVADGSLGDCGSGCDALAPGGEVVGDAGGDGTGPDADAGLVTGCPATPFPAIAPTWPASSGTAPKPPSTACATPGWPGVPQSAPIVLNEATASFGLPALPLVDRCLLPHDFDGDGKTDLALVELPTKPGAPRTLWWMRQKSGSFDKTVLELPTSLAIHGCVAADLDQDGDSDIALVGTGGLFVVRNDSGVPAQQTVKLDLKFQQKVNGIAALDIDRDGDLDLVVAEAKKGDEAKDWSSPCTCSKSENKPYTVCKGGFCGALHHHFWRLRNDGGFNFVSQGALPDIAGDMWSFSVADPDRDGWQDIFVGNEWGQHGWLHNGGGQGFSALTTAVGLLPWAHVMGSVVADLDLDGFDDVFIADYGVDTGYRLEPGKGWVNASATWKLWESWQTAVSWGAIGADLDSDGWLDLFVSNSGVMTEGSFWAVITDNSFVSVDNPGHQLWHNQGGPFAVQTVPHPKGNSPDVQPTRLAVADLDDDGDLDVIDVPLSLEARILRNDTPQGGWLRVHLVGASSPRGGEGAWVEVWSAGRVQRRAWTHSPGHSASGTQQEHFGVGAVQVDLLRVWWPSGKVSEIANPKLDTLHTVVEPKGAP